MTVGIVGKRDERAAAVVDDLATHLSSEGVELRLEESTRNAIASHDPDGTDQGAVPPAAPIEAFSECDLVVSVGGDGTFLYAAREAGTTPILGVNLGEVGFLNAVAPDRAIEAVTSVLREIREDGRADTLDLPRVRAEGDGWSLAPAVNEVVLQGPRRGRGGGIDVTVRVDGDRYTAGHADGVLVATGTGSTAYNLSEGGPLVHPAVDGLVVTTMNEADGMPPLVVASDRQVAVRLEGADRGYVVGDGRETRQVDPPSTVRVELADAPVAVAGPPLDFFAALDKLD